MREYEIESDDVILHASYGRTATPPWGSTADCQAVSTASKWCAAKRGGGSRARPIFRSTAAIASASARAEAEAGVSLTRAIPTSVAHDVRDGLIAAADATAIYGVVIDPATQKVDRAATDKLRSETSGRRTMIKVATDAGGTFTDLVAFEETSGKIYVGKALTTPKDPSQGVIHSIAQSRETGLATSEISFFVHGGTTVINAITERKGVRTALVTTEGFRDVIAIGRGNRPDLYNLHSTPPRTLRAAASAP